MTLLGISVPSVFFFPLARVFCFGSKQKEIKALEEIQHEALCFGSLPTAKMGGISTQND
jgi:hypothetical protein